VFERSLDRFFATIPGWFDPAWRFLYDVLCLWAIVLVVYGRDAYDTQLASKFWRTVLYQDAGPRLRLQRNRYL
jgi:hypothetical protein